MVIVKDKNECNMSNVAVIVTQCCVDTDKGSLTVKQTLITACSFIFLLYGMMSHGI